MEYLLFTQVMDLKNLKLTIAYDGGSFFGWQDSGQQRTVESFLRHALEQVLQQKIELQAASRTDRGVHAEGQVINFFCRKPHIDLKKLQQSVNSLLSRELTILTIEEMPEDFHPTLDCFGKEYHYLLSYDAVLQPKDRHYVWHFPYELDHAAMQQAAQLLIGKHDFKAFCNQRKNLNYASTERTIDRLDLIVHPQKKIRFVIKGQNFLYKMVRNVVGALVYIGNGKMTLHHLASLLKDGQRKQAAITAPALGLTLMEVFYSEDAYNCCEKSTSVMEFKTS